MCPATTKVRFTGGVYGARMFVLLSMAFSMALNGESLGTDRYAPIAFDPATKNWMQFKVGDHVEVSPACSENYQPATVSAVAPDPNGHIRYTVAYPDGQTFGVTIPANYYSACVRPAGAVVAGHGTKPAITVMADRNWSRFHAGSRVEVSPACLSYAPATVVSVNPSSFGSSYKSYHVRYATGVEFDQEVPSVRAVCVRAAGGIARERAAFPPPAAVSYQCNYRGTVQPAFDFTLIDRSSYHDYDGRRGAYRYDTVAKRVVFESGPKAGSSFQQVSANSFDVLDKDGTATGTYCTR